MVRQRSSPIVDQVRESILKPFVANRVSAIEELTDNDQWHHIDGKDNPADWASRGVSMQELLKPDNIWFMSPTILNSEQIEFPIDEIGPDLNVVNKEKKKLQLNFHAENDEDFLNVNDYWVIPCQFIQKFLKMTPPLLDAIQIWRK